MKRRLAVRRFIAVVAAFVIAFNAVPAYAFEKMGDNVSDVLVPQTSNSFQAQATGDLPVSSYRFSYSKDNGSTWFEVAEGCDIAFGDMVKVELDWRFGAGTMVQAGDSFTYPLPNGLDSSGNKAIRWTEQTGNIMNGANIDGTFAIGGEQLTINYSVDEGANVSGSIHFEGELVGSESDRAEGYPIAFTFSGLGSITLPVGPVASSLNVEKEYTTDTSDASLKHFVYSVTSTGKNTNVVLNDSMGGLLKLANGNVVVATDKAGAHPLTSGYSVTGNAAGGNSFTVTLDEMSDGDVVYVLYDVTCDPELASLAGTSAATANNVQYHSNQFNPSSPKTTTTNVTEEKTWKVTKSGTAEDETINWTIVVDAGSNGDISGAIISDSFPTESPYQEYYDGGEVEVSTDGVNWASTGKVVSWNRNCDAFTFTVPENSKGKLYRITYTTMYKEKEIPSPGRMLYPNTVNVDPHGDSTYRQTVTKKVAVGDDDTMGSIQKQSLSTTLTNRPEWLLTVTAQEDLVEAEIYDNTDGRHAVDLESVKIYTNEACTDEYTELWTAQKYANTGMYLQFNKTIPAGTTLYVRYFTEMSPGYVAKEADDLGFKLSLQNDVSLTYEGNVDPKTATATYVSHTHMIKGSKAGTETSGLFQWYFSLSHIPADADVVTIVDTLPQNHEIILSSVSGVRNQFNVTEKYSGVTAVDNGDGTATFTVSGETLDAARMSGAAIMFQTRWADPSLVTTLSTVTNTAQLSIDGVQEPSTSATLQVEPPTLLKKTQAYNSTTAPLALYSIDVNPGKLKLNNGNTLELHDVLGSALQLVMGSVKIDGTPIENKEGFSYDYNPSTHTMILSMPDETPATLSYSAYVTLAPGETLNNENASNIATLKGMGGVEKSADTVITGRVLTAAASTSSEYKELMVYKYAVNEDRPGSVSTPLAGAGFSVEQLNVQKNGNTWETTGVAAQVANLSSAANGYTNKVGNLYLNTVYRITETAVPNGYRQADPIYVIFPSSDTVDYSGVTVDGYPLSSMGTVQTGIVYVGNQSSTQHTAVTLNGVKTITGRPFCSTDSFTFNIAAEGGAPLPKNASGEEVSSLTITPSSGNRAALNFGTITYSTDDLGGASSKDFVYVIGEQAGTQGGLVYDSQPCTVTVTVSQDASGNLSSSIAYRKGSGAADSIEFNNAYDSVGVNVSAQVNKVLTGRPLIAGEFAYYLVKRGETTSIVGYGVNDTDGKITLLHPTTDAEGRTYTLDDLADVACASDGSRSKTFAYTVYEVTKSLTASQLEDLSAAQRADYATKTILPDGITAVTSSRDFTVTISDDGKGHMSASTSCLSVITPVGGSPYTNTGTKLTLSNTYRPESTKLALRGSKTVVSSAGITPPSLKGGDFTFTLSSSDDSAPLPAVVAVTNAADGSISFGDIEFTASNLAGVDWAGGTRSKDFVYTITESGEKPGYTIDASPQTVTVRLTDDGSGHLQAQVVSPATAPNFTFQNTYNPTPAVASLKASKTVQTPALLPGIGITANDFSFTLTAQGAAPMPEGVTGSSQVVGNKASSTNVAEVAFGDISFSTPGTYTYTITENPTNQSTGAPLPGFVYDPSSYTATVQVTDDESGTLKAAVTYSKGGASAEAAAFTNSYEPTDTSISLAGVKEIVGVGSAAAEDEPTIAELISAGYSFTLSAQTAGAPLPANTTATFAPGADSLHGTVSFGAIPFTASDIASGSFHDGVMSKDFVYTIHENVPATPFEGLTSASDRTVTIRVTDNMQGTVSAKVIKANEAAPDFTMTNVFSGTYAVLQGTKTIQGRQFRNGDAFTFDITAVTPGAPKLKSAQGEEHDSITVKPVSGTSAALDFGAAVFTGDDLPAGVTSKDFIYSISERAGGIAGMSYDSAVYYAKVTLESSASDFSASVHYFKDKDCTQSVDTISFVNSYNAASTTASISATKKLVGASGFDAPELKAGDYSFTLRANNAAYPLPEGARDGVITAQNAADGSISFGAITFTEAGTYTYTLAEQAGNRSGITYDTSTHLVQVKVTDDGGGHLSAAVRYDVASDGSGGNATSPTFTNTYRAAQTQVSFNAHKTLHKRTLQAGQFQFTLQSTTQGLLQTKTNDASGAVAFDSLTFDTPGTYTYKVAEKQDTEDGVKFDATVYTVTVTVTDDAAGALHASTTYSTPTGTVSTMTFVNSYEPGDAHITLAGTKTYNGASPAGFTFTARGPKVSRSTAGDGTTTTSVTNDVVAKGASDSDGSIVLDPITYSLDDLIAMREAGMADFASTDTGDTYTVYYNVVEDGAADDLPSRGIQPVVSSQIVSVKIVDNGHALAATANYGSNSQLVFVNVYNPTTPIISLVGQKAVVSQGSPEDMATVSDIAGAYTFVLESSDSTAPLPQNEEGEQATTASNDINGQVAFMPISFGLKDIADAPYEEDGTRHRDFTYTITEEGTYEHITNDTDQTVTVRLTDDGEGNLKAVVLDEASGDVGTQGISDLSFAFANEYKNDPVTPDKPDKPSKPTNPDTPQGTSSNEPGDSLEDNNPEGQISGSGYNAQKLAKVRLASTADNLGLAPTLLTIVAVAACAVLAVCVVRRRATRNRQLS